MRRIVDRIERNIAVCEMNDKQMCDFDVALFSSTPKDGNVFEYDGVRATILEDETEKKKEHIQSAFDRLKKK